MAGRNLLSAVANDANSMNVFGMDISSIFIEPSDPTGKTVYLTVEGAEDQVGKRSRLFTGQPMGGAHWTDLTSNLPEISGEQRSGRSE